MTESLAEAYPKELNRVKELLIEYEKIPTGTFGAAMLRILIDKSEKALQEQDTVLMIQCFKEMKECN